MWEGSWDVKKLWKSHCTLTFRSVLFIITLVFCLHFCPRAFTDSVCLPWQYKGVAAWRLGVGSDPLCTYRVLQKQRLPENPVVYWHYQVNQKTVTSHCVFCGSYCSTLLPELLHESGVVATLLNGASKWKKEGESGGLCELSGCPDGDECHVNANVVVVIMSLSGHEETLGKDDRDLGMVKLRG